MRGCGALIKEEVKEFILFAKENIYMNTPILKEDGSNLEPFNEAAFEKMYKELPKKYFPPRDGYGNEERVELAPLWSYIEKEAETDGVLF